ncbi:MAG: hypothetical protein LRS43_03195 [Desulfurococcales archaeon]|nr:hypothetical protein [Desulfurococcales archaeon]
MDHSMVNYTINRLAESLHEHAGLLSEASRYALLAKSRPQDPTVACKILEVLESLRGLRERMIEDARLLLDSVGSIGDEEIEDVKALAGYYLVAAYKEEIEFLSSISGVVDVSRDLRDAETLAGILGRLTRGHQPSP